MEPFVDLTGMSIIKNKSNISINRIEPVEYKGNAQYCLLSLKSYKMKVPMNLVQLKRDEKSIENSSTSTKGNSPMNSKRSLEVDLDNSSDLLPIFNNLLVNRNCY